MPSRSAISACLLRLLLVVSALLAVAGAPVSAQPSTPVPDHLEPVLPAWRDELAGVLERAAAAYSIDAEIAMPSGDGIAPQVRGTVTVAWTNTTGETIDALPFRLYANGPAEGHDAMRVTSATRDGVPVAPEPSGNGTTVSIPLDPALAPGETATVALAYTLDVPVGSREQYGILNITPGRGTWALAQWYPVIAGRDPEGGWVLDPPSVFGDPIFSDIASYDVTFRAPADWRVVSTGITIETTERGAIAERRIVTGPVRDITLVLDNDFESVETEVNGTTITSWYQPGHERVGQAVLTYAAQALAYFNELIGPYPYATLDVVPVDLFGAAGVEFPQLIYIGASYYREDYDLSVPNGLDFTVAHEVLHQWWYGLVGNNQYDHAYIDEGLTNFMSSELYFTAMYGPEAGEAMARRYLENPFESHNRAAPDVVVDTPTDAFPSNSDYSYAAYQKAPMGFKAIYEAIGHDAFADAVQRYYAEHRFTTATPDDLLAAFEAASGRDLDDLWTHWFEEAHGA
jgi:hypothetical protein